MYTGTPVFQNLGITQKTSERRLAVDGFVSQQLQWLVDFMYNVSRQVAWYVNTQNSLQNVQNSQLCQTHSTLSTWWKLKQAEFSFGWWIKIMTEHRLKQCKSNYTPRPWRQHYHARLPPQDNNQLLRQQQGNMSKISISNWFCWFKTSCRLISSQCESLVFGLLWTVYNGSGRLGAKVLSFVSNSSQH